MRNQGTPKRQFSLGLLLFVLWLASVPLAFGQATTGTISGVVSDQSGATVAQATVTVRNLDTNATRSVTTQEDGRFNIPSLPVGRYELNAELAGFAKYVRGPINLLLNQVAVVNPELRPAGVTETITVTEDAPLLSTTNAEVGVRFDEKRLTDLPTNPPGGRADAGGFRDVFAFALSAPGVSQLNSGNSAFAAGTNFSVNGMRPRGNNFMIDGQDSNDPSITGRQQVMNNPDIVQEFRLITNQFLPEYGRSAGSVVNVITRSGTNHFHGSAFWFHNDNQLNSRSNLDKANFTSAPFRIENQFGGTAGGPIWKDHTFFFGSLQRWTDRQLGSGTTISGVPSDAGRQVLQSNVGDRPQIQALLKHLPAAQPGTTLPKPVSFCLGGGTLPNCTGGRKIDVPAGTLTGSVSSPFNNWQWSTRIDHHFARHQLGGRYLYNNSIQSGNGQATPANLTTDNKQRQQALTLFLTSTVTPRMVNELRLSWQRLGNNTVPTSLTSLEIPSIEIAELGLTGFNSGTNRTAIGLAVNQPQFRFNNTYQIQENLSWNRRGHALKFGIDFRRIDVKSFFLPTIRGRLSYPTLQSYVDDISEVADINRPVPGTSPIQYYKWYDYFAYFQDSWAVKPTFTLNYGLRYETPGNALASLYPVSDQLVQSTSNSLFRLDPRPQRDTNNFQPRVGFAWTPRTSQQGLLGRLAGGKFVLRGGYSRTNDYAFINLALNVASSFPFVFAISNPPNFKDAFKILPTQVLPPSNLLTRTIIAGDFRAPIAEQFNLEVQRQFATNTVFRVGYIGTKGTGLFETIDGNPRTVCSPIPSAGCPRVDPSRGVIRLRANAGSSIYHSVQLSLDKRFSKGLSAGAHYTWSSFIDEASDTFNASARGEVAVAQDSFNRRADRGRSTYDRPHRFAANFVYELPFLHNQPGLLGHVAGGWQVSSFITFQSGSPFTPLNGADPASALSGISGLVGNAIRPNLNTNLNLSGMSVEEILQAGGRSLFTTITAAQRLGNAGRSILRSDGIANWDFSVLKSFRITESQQFQFRADFFNFTNTRNFGIPEARVNNSGFANQWGTDGGNRRIFMSLRYVF